MYKTLKKNAKIAWYAEWFKIFHKESLKDLVFCKKIQFTIKRKVDGNNTQI